MAYGDIVYATVGYTQSDAASVRKGYPIKQKYKQIEQTQNPRFPSSYQLASIKYYWLPFSAVSAADTNYIEYTEGDEYGWSDSDEKRAPEIPFSNPKTIKFEDYPVNYKIIFANEIYVATRYTFEWGATEFGISSNPYKSSKVRKWRKFTDTSDTWTQYWYHPLLKRFYTIQSLDELTELPDFDEPTQTRWDGFVGDARDMNLNNFTFAQIRELISRGSSQATAEAEVAALEERARTASDATELEISSSGTPLSGTFIVNRQATGQTGDSPIIPENLPRMVQRITTGAAGQKTVIDTYVFNLRPNNVSYSNIGITWTEIDRVNNFPLVDYKNNKLMKINFEFVVEAHIVGVSSLYESCEDRLKQLQRIANRPELVTFTNFDSLFSEAAVFNTLQANYREWAIVDMSISSIQRTPSGSDSEVGSISRATVNMTIQEVRLTRDQVIFMPKLRKTPGVPNRPTPENEPELCIELATDSVGALTPKIPYSKCWYQNRGLTPIGS